MFMHKQTLSLALVLSLAAGTVFAQAKRNEIPPPPPEFFAQEKAEQLRANQPMSQFDVSKAVAYEIVRSSGNPGMIWIVSKEADTFEKRAHTALKAAEDLYNENKVSTVRVYLATIPQYPDFGEFYQAVATYEAKKRTWRVFAHVGEAFPEWRVEITREWLDEVDRVGGEAKIDKATLQDRLGRQYNIQPSYVEPIKPADIKMKPYIK